MKNKQNKSLNICVFILFILFALLLVKRLFFGIDVDEQYSVTLLYRMATGDGLLKELWEPHQTSAILFTGLVKAFLLITGGSTTYLVLFLRMVGVVFQAFVCVLWGTCIWKMTDRLSALLSCGMVLLCLPKWIISPEFANLQIWLTILTIVCLWKGKACSNAEACIPGRKEIIWTLLAGVTMTFLVLDYPSCVLLLPVFLVYLLAKRFHVGRLCCFLLPPVAGASVFLIFLRKQMTWEEVFLNLQSVLADGSHSKGMGEKLYGYVCELPELFLYCSIYAGIAFVLGIVFFLIAKKQIWTKVFFEIVLSLWVAVAVIDQLRFWFVNRGVIAYPQYWVVVTVTVGILIFVMADKPFRAKWNDLFLLCYFSGFASFVAVLILSNLEMKADYIFAFPAVLCSLLMLWDRMGQCVHGNIFPGICGRIAVFAVLLVSFAGQFFLVKVMNNGFYEDITYARQKVLSGPAKMIYADWLEGYELNENQNFLNSIVPGNSKVLYVGNRQITNLLGNYEICEPSTISTPTYGVVMRDYFERNPEKNPEYVIIDKEFWRLYFRDCSELCSWLQDYLSLSEKLPDTWEESLEVLEQLGEHNEFVIVLQHGE